ncbi:N-acetylmuramoyl-L-alanine amidase [Nocardia bhagyanarayanae]|uniref:N-acetylmuramoyl-L-alanine amidase n=1 Tax=Nocardia bhagyanarayanae TaxID=1215925 RepID=A0A543F7R2_9NOCA|nr:N-acetylmuramoyl-L-alanine amidase [Nocardia bhagyanarayanae]TQM29872.1 N-acetylmuramoyl-L-alanine amidase [Nocardia bhagyanarayanae]
MSWTGDPVWLADVLRAEGLRVVEFPGWRERGHGDFGEIWGIIAHHTGGSHTPSSEIAYGFAHLAGPLSQLHLDRDGTVTVVAAGVSWHAGRGRWPGLPEDDANFHTIGIEAVNNGTEGWSREQYDAYVGCCAAILRRIGHGADRVIGHKEWAGTKQGKWDPGGMDMDRFRADIAERLKGGVLMALSDVEQRELLDKLRRVHFELTYGFQSRVADSEYRDTVAGYVLNSDAADYRNEQRLKAVELKIDRLLDAMEGRI